MGCLVTGHWAVEQANAERGGGGSAARAGASDAGLEVNSSFLVVKKVQSVNLQCRSQKCVGCSGVHMRPDGSRAILFNGVAVFYVTGYDKIVTSAEQSINRRSCAQRGNSSGPVCTGVAALSDLYLRTEAPRPRLVQRRTQTPRIAHAPGIRPDADRPDIIATTRRRHLRDNREPRKPPQGSTRRQHLWIRCATHGSAGHLWRNVAHVAPT